MQFCFQFLCIFQFLLTVKQLESYADLQLYYMVLKTKI